MELEVRFSAGKPKFIQIYESIRQEILIGTLQTDTQLPAKRTLAAQLNVSVITVQQAYDQLASEGYIYSIERQGYFVAALLEEWHEKESLTGELPAKQQAFIPAYNFKNGQVDAQSFPYKQWLPIYRETLKCLSPQNAPWQGEESLRRAIAQYLATARGLSCSEQQIFIFSGFQQQFMNCILFFKNGTMGMEEPGFIRAKSILQQLERPYQLIPIDENGCQVPECPLSCLYTTPAHQFPNGQIMPIQRRIELLNWAKQNQSVIIEDDYDSEFRYTGHPIPTLANLDRLQHVIYFGTFSKTLIPSLRISYIVLPVHFVQPFEEFNKHSKSTVSKVDQQTLAEFMRKDLYSKHVAKMRVLYRKKRARLLESIKSYLGPDFQVKGEEAGLHVVLELPNGITEDAVIAKAEQHGILLDRVSVLYERQKPAHQIMLGYGEPSLDEIEQGIKKLAEIL
ncbi:PLP-dependent aminotransferase family protein [Bacillus badius]|uniref:MocR-like pyridoxine biosynthesis transcription factor PdxR n=1 Tax=Bacillus badius TaxID=1455 RepID=UPI0005976928|nr:PLP-dependent aminotransferase family protein [Bacillus badius]KIL74076.1 putative transcriptional regulator of pyridoxine metabolism [Bacillus badius]